MKKSKQMIDADELEHVFESMRERVKMDVFGDFNCAFEFIEDDIKEVMRSCNVEDDPVGPYIETLTDLNETWWFLQSNQRYGSMQLFSAAGHALMTLFQARMYLQTLTDPKVNTDDFKADDLKTALSQEINILDERMTNMRLYFVEGLKDRMMRPALRGLKFMEPPPRGEGQLKSLLRGILSKIGENSSFPDVWQELKNMAKGGASDVHEIDEEDNMAYFKWRDAPYPKKTVGTRLSEIKNE